MKREKKAGLAIILGISIILLITFIIAATNTISKERRLEIKNCIADATKIRDACNKKAKDDNTWCKLNVKISKTNNKQKILDYAKCQSNFTLAFSNCNEALKVSKDNCYLEQPIPPIGINKCSGNYKDSDKQYLIGDPLKCESQYVLCAYGSPYFIDECGCGCTVLPSVGNCIKITNDLLKEKDNIQKCNKNSDCNIGNIGLPCTFDSCFSIYNNNSDLYLIKKLSKQFTDNQCSQVCPMYACISPEFMQISCVNHKCVAKTQIM